LAKDTKAMAAIALEFDDYISELLEERLDAESKAPEDITTELLRQKIDGRLLNHEEIVSILRNWTVGELGTITACVGILAHYLAEKADLQQQLRENSHLLPAAIDEILRIHAPLISNRRVTTTEVDIGGRKIEAGQRVTLMWASANRDEAVFGDPDEFRLDRDPAQNLLYGRGIHVCPGAQLARLELRVVMEELLKATRQIALVPDHAPEIAVYPASGFSSLIARIS
jgi:cytochrome P450